MKLCLNLPPIASATWARQAEALDFDIVFAPEGYTCDAVSVIAAAAGATHRITLASGVMQAPGRPPGMTALTAASLANISGGRFHLGLGVSNPHVADGWYGQAFDRPVARMRDYVEVIRAALSGTRVTRDSPFYALPAHGFDNAPLHLVMPPTQHPVPIYLGAIGPKMLALAGEVADGWLSGFTTPQVIVESVREINLARRTAGKTGTFEVIPFMGVGGDADPRVGAESLRQRYAQLLAVGAGDNFYVDLARDMGFTSAMDRFIDAVREGALSHATAEIPFEFIDATSLLGSPPRMASRIRELAAAGVTGISLMISAHRDGPGRWKDLMQLAREAIEQSNTSDTRHRGM